jgi:serine protease Do
VVTVTSPAPSGTGKAGVPADFSKVYADVQSGVGLVLVSTCDGVISGSGFLVDERTLATAAHVVDDARYVSVELAGVRQPAHVIGVDASIDVALLSLDAPVDGHVFTFARRDPQPGTHVAAIGFPFDEPKSLTEGTVSGLGRDITTESGEYHGLLQTDTAINPGNSGGPFVDLQGDVIGMADAIRRGAQGIGFAVPVSIAGPSLTDRSGLFVPQRPMCSTAGDTVENGVHSTLQAYLSAINAGDYAAAMRQVSDSYRAANFSDPQKWREAYASSYDDELVVMSVTGPENAPTVWATFRSQQDAGDGPTDDPLATCVVWSVDYDMVQQGSHWVIDGASGHNDPPFTRC